MKPILLPGLYTLTLILFISSCQLGRFVYYNFADIGDHKIFPNKPLTASQKPFQFATASQGKFPITLNDIPFDEFLEKHKTVAFLIIKNDTIQYEKYFDGYDRTHIIPSFSMAKSVISILIGCAIDDGLIQSVEDPVIHYIPELKDNGFENVKIKHVLQMTSGLDFNESYVNPFGDAAALYYGTNLRKQVSKMKLKQHPGKQFEYVSGNSQLLGLILERALTNKDITEYAQEKLWSPLGSEFDASWSIDSKKSSLEKTFCCLNARAIDFAKIGRLYKNFGDWNGQQIISEEWVRHSIMKDTTEGSKSYYQYQWWLPEPGQSFMAEGILGQYIYVHPAKNLIIVRLGKKQGKTDWWKVFTSMANAY